MPTLNWIGKDAVVNHHHTVPFHLLRDVPELAVGDPGGGNLIVEGDNLVALKALLPYYAGQVKCIYIDPPYNTGNEGWIYNDNVNSPLIREWLGKVVGNEASDLSRHDKWLCMMYPRLQLLRQFLREDGAIFVSIDDNEGASLRLVMDEIFGKQNYVSTFTWKSRAKPSNTGDAKLKPQNDAEYVICYKKSAFPKFRLVHSGRERSYPHSDKDGKYRLQTILKSNRGESKRETMQFALEGYQPPPTKRWQAGEETIKDLYRRNRITFQTGEPMLKYYEHEERSEFSPFYCHVPRELSGTAEEGKQTLNGILGIEHGFDTVKPLQILNYVLDRLLLPGDLILDSFAGSGTTGHAVLQLNKQDGGNRRFILVELEPKIAREITAERVKRVAEGYANAKGEAVDGIGGGFRYCTLGEPLFDARGQIRESVTFAELARHVYFTETGEPLPRERVSKSSLLGECRGVAVYLLFNGVLGDKRANGGNVLTRAVLAKLPKFDGPKVIYAAGCLLGRDRLQAERITFRQTPYEIKVS